MAQRGAIEKDRVEAFSDGVIAIIITVMVLELKIPTSGEVWALGPLVPDLLTYALSFVYVGIYWNNHHHLFAATERVNGAVLWANLHLLFWLSLFPVMMAWMGRFPSSAAPAVVYSVVLLLAGLAYRLLVIALVAANGPKSVLAKAMGRDFKGTLSIVLYAIAIAGALIHPWIAETLFVIVALLWVIPDRRIERRMVRQRNPLRAKKLIAQRPSEAASPNDPP